MKKERSKTRIRGIRQINGRWEYRFMVDGREYSRVTDLKATERNLSKVAALLEIHNRRVLAGTALVSEKVPFSRATEAFLEWSRANRKENTAKRHRTSAASLVHFFRDQRINTIRPGHLENYKTWRVDCQIKPVSIRHDLHAASQLFQFAQKQGWCESNPVKLVEMPSDRESRNDRILSVEEEQKYLAAAANNDSLYDFARLMLQQGLRPQELLELQKNHVDLEKRELHVIDSKTAASTRTINLTSESCVILGRRLAGSSPWVFPSRRKVWHRRRREFYWVIIDDKHLTYSGIFNAHRKACRKSGVGYGIYSLRHTFATRFYRATKDIESLRRVLGHADLKTLLRYVHIDKDDLRVAMETFERSRSNVLQKEVVQ